MKTLNDFLTYNYISLKGIDEELVKSINNLDGQKINECCGCCCEPCCDDVKCCDPYSYPKYFSESEIVSMLRNTPKIQNIWDIHYQFSNRYRFPGITLEETKEPLYFRGYGLTGGTGYQSGEPQTTTLMPTDALYNEKLYNYIKGIVDEFKFGYPTVLETEGKVQIFFVKGEGGFDEKDKSIKKGLEDVAKILGKLESKEEINWSQVLDVSINNVGNVYNFLITCTLDITPFQMTADDYKKWQKKFEKEAANTEDK